MSLQSYSWQTVLGSSISGVFLGSIYALVALGLTLIYGVLHIINFAHGSLLMLAMYAVFFLWNILGLDPYLSMLIVVPGGYLFGYTLQRTIIGKASHGKDEITLLVMLGVSIVMENTALFFFTATDRSVRVPYDLDGFDLGVTYVVYPEIAALLGSLLITLVLWFFMSYTDTGKAIRAVSKERQGARLVGINVEHIFAVSFGIGTACVAAAAALLVPTYAVHPQIGYLFVLIAFTVVVLGGMGSFVGALAGGLIIGVTEQLGRLYLGESLGLITISVIFIIVLLFRPTGLFGSKSS
ncbi:MAG TPA: branched-chain amino acid ABC transporter permease [Candidatus Lambdaproteobacteria bacterium]|nr:branched-chain amino acid ABC transporter permease [Candidatus Lambdaproteobacteria bacterium]HIA33441.1 branched-chain amino acid ABC transporter permease [Candidatus Lambdaproteobacteria bacterium]HIB39215.1 branched-chain amino acid ABC transporter permease [Candidatus Lambdaproteobacteria bacterium]